MLLIFDIDDTLIDTSGSVIPHFLNRCVACASERICSPDSDAARSEIAELNSRLGGSEAALEAFVARYGGSSADVRYILDRIDDSGLSDAIAPTPGALQALEVLRKEHLLAIVSYGDPRRQRAKLAAAGLPSAYFAAMHIAYFTSKGTPYEALLRNFAVSAKETLVVGDRIARDLTPAKRLGLTTVHMKWGRGLGNTGVKRDVDYTILQLEELQRLPVCI